MKIEIVHDQQQGAQLVVEEFQTLLARRSGAATFGLATGDTPLAVYQQLAVSPLDFSTSTSFNLDEYVGITPTNLQSYHYYMNKNLFKYKQFANSYLLDGQNPDQQTVCENYEKLIAQHPIDVQLLGIGRNGHIGFNEPGTSFESRTHRVKLSETTIQSNSRFFDDQNQVPRYAYSMGIGTIMAARKIILMAYGANKAAAVAKMVNGPVSVAVPASVLQRHPQVEVILDEPASTGLSVK